MGVWREGALCVEACHPGYYAAHGAGISLSRAYMDDGLLADHVIMVVEGEGHGGGSSELGQGFVRDSKTLGVGKKLYVRQP